MKKRIIAVVGATGAQGGGVVNSLIDNGVFEVRAITRNPEKYSGRAHGVVSGDLDDIDSLRNAFKAAYGVFVVTNAWGHTDEIAQARNAIDAAKAEGVEHFIWSTLPNVETISKGEFEVPHFTNKAKVDDLVKHAGFKYYTFVQPPFYFQNLLQVFAPHPKPDGTTGWTIPIDPTKKVFHMSDINDLGKVVTGAFLKPGEVGKGSYLSLATELNSFNEIVKTYKLNGKDYSVSQIPAEVFSTFFEGAKEVAAMLKYFEKYTYMGPNSQQRIDQAKKIATEDFVHFKAWIKQVA